MKKGTAIISPLSEKRAKEILEKDKNIHLLKYAEQVKNYTVICRAFLKNGI